MNKKLEKRGQAKPRMYLITEKIGDKMAIYNSLSPDVSCMYDASSSQLECAISEVTNFMGWIAEWSKNGVPPAEPGRHLVAAIYSETSRRKLLIKGSLTFPPDTCRNYVYKKWR